MASDNIAMARPGTQYSGPEISLSWPMTSDRDESGQYIPGVREVKALPPGKRSSRIQQMMVGPNAKIVEVDDEETAPGSSPSSRRPIDERLFAGGSNEANRIAAEPAGPITRRIFVPAGELQEQEVAPSPDREEWPPAGEGGEGQEQEADEPLTDDERTEKLVADNTRAELEAIAADLGIGNAAEAPNKTAIAEAIVEAQNASSPADPAAAGETTPTTAESQGG